MFLSRPGGMVGYCSLTIVFAALATARYLQDATAMSVRRIHILRPVQQITVRITDHEHVAADPVTPAAEAIFGALDAGAQ